eukprot:256901-Chlamydomonas_euryale.AAC.1
MQMRTSEQGDGGSQGDSSGGLVPGSMPAAYAPKHESKVPAAAGRESTHVTSPGCRQIIRTCHLARLAS